MYSDMASWNIQSCQPHTNTFPTITYKHSNINHDDHIIEGNNLNENISSDDRHHGKTSILLRKRKKIMNHLKRIKGHDICFWVGSKGKHQRTYQKAS